MIISGGLVLCKCGENAARYMNERGELCCAICPLKEGIDSIKLDDVPKLLAWARGLIEFCQQDNIEIPKLTYRLLGELIDIVQRTPKPTPSFGELIAKNRAEGGCGCAPGTVLCPH